LSRLMEPKPWQRLIVQYLFCECVMFDDQTFCSHEDCAESWEFRGVLSAEWLKFSKCWVKYVAFVSSINSRIGLLFSGWKPDTGL
jgi:uncharacterized protein YjaG (DUF416 family)